MLSIGRLGKLNDTSFGSLLPGRKWEPTSTDKYRFGFNGKEMDDETFGEGNVYDYGFRIYNPRIGKFLSVDPLFKGYPELTPFQFSSNRPIDGIDLDGLEYIPANEARVEFKSGRLELKVENFFLPNRKKFEQENANIINWKKANGQDPGEIGIDETIFKLDFTLIESKIPEASDVVDVPNSASGDNKNGVGKPKKTTDGNSGKSGNKMAKTSNYPTKAAVQNRTQAAITGVVELFRAYIDLCAFIDATIIDDHKSIARKVVDQVNKAQFIKYMGTDLIPEDYRTPERLTAIMNVVLQGVNTTNDPKIYQIGMKVFDYFNPKLEFTPSNLDGVPGKAILPTVFIPNR